MNKHELGLSVEKKPSVYKKGVLVNDYGLKTRPYEGLFPLVRAMGGSVIDQMISVSKNKRDDIVGFRVTRARRYLVTDVSGVRTEAEEVDPAARTIWISYPDRQVNFFTPDEARKIANRGRSALDWATKDGVEPRRVVCAWNGNFYPAGLRDRIIRSNKAYPRED